VFSVRCESFSVLIFIYTLLFPKDKRAKRWKRAECNAVQEIGEHWIDH